MTTALQRAADALKEIAARQLGADLRAARGLPPVDTLRRAKQERRNERDRIRRAQVARWRYAAYPWNLPHPEPVAERARRLAAPAVGGGAC